MQSMRSYKPYVEFRLTESRIRLKTADGANRIVEISPGSSFGAEHPTTRLCIMALEEIFNERAVKTVLDFGCGSGVLGICAASLGAGGVLAVDLDPSAVKEAKVNFEKNKLDSIGQVRHGSTEDVRGRFELIIANIVTDDLVTLVHWFRSTLSEDGILLVSGVYEIKEEALVTAYTKAGFRVINRYRESGWLAISFDIESGG
jgi:ribosomal protein L11 methyltransferase